MEITPLYDRIVVQRAKPQEETRSGLIVLPVNRMPNSAIAKVISVGQGKNFDGAGVTEIEDASGSVQMRRVGRMKPCAVRPGDWILMGKFSGNEITLKIEDPPVIVLREDEVMAILTFAEGEPLPRLLAAGETLDDAPTAAPIPGPKLVTTE